MSGAECMGPLPAARWSRMATVHPASLYALFILSGFCGLIYQVVWVREYGNVFGVTVYSATLVMGVFMCGLGVGSYAAGVWADRRHTATPSRIIAAYGAIEIAVGCLGALLAFAIPGLESVSAAATRYTVQANGWHELSLWSSVWRYGAAALLIAPSTLLMGATLPLLIRFVVADQIREMGWRVGVLYGLNTAGAALGCFLVDFHFVPTIGLLRTQLFAAGVNVIVGGAALVLYRGHPRAAVKPPKGAAASETGVSGEAQRALRLIAAGSFCFGVTAMGIEILWFRFLTGSLGEYRSVFSVVLTVILVGIWLGALLGGYLHRRFRRPALTLIVAQGVFVALTMMLLVGFDPRWANRYFTEVITSPATEGLTIGPQYWGVLRSTAFVVGIPSLLMGLTFPLANAHIQHTSALIGRRAGTLYLANTLGNVVGVVMTGFVLLPSLGSQHTTLVLAAVTCAGIACVFGSIRPTSRDRASGYALALGLGLGLISCAGWAGGLSENYLLWRNQSELEMGSRYVAMHEDITETLAISHDPRGRRTLWTNGHPMSGTILPAQRYMRAFSHIPLLQIAEPKTALVICFGVGTTAHAASAHLPLERLEIVDMSRAVLEHASYFSETNGNVLADPRVAVFINDGRQHLRMQPPHTYDLVTLEPPPISSAGVASLYSREFYTLVRERLKKGGYLTQWLPIYQVDGATALSMVRAFVDVFPNAVLLSGHQAELILLGQRDGDNQIDVRAVERNLALRPTVQQDLEHVAMGSLTEIIGTFVADAETLRRVTAEAAPITDDLPTMEYTIISHAMRNLIPAELFTVNRISSWCASCFEAGVPIEPVEDLERYLAVMGAMYESRMYLFHSTLDEERPSDAPVFDEAMRATIARERYLDAMHGRRLRRR